MAQCKWCNISGWFIFLDSAGLCNQCSKIVKLEVQQRMRIVNESVKIVDNSKNLETRLSRLNLIYEQLNELYKFEQHGIDIIKPSPSNILEQLRGKKDQIILEVMSLKAEEAQKRSALAKTLYLKSTPLLKVLENITEYKEKLDDPNILSALEQRVKNTIQTLHIDGHLIRAQVGSDIAKQHTSLESEKRNKVEQQAMDYLITRLFKEASLAVANFEAEQVVSRGLGVDWKHYDPKSQIEILDSIFKSDKPGILSKLDDNKLEPLRIAAAMMEMWGTNTATKWLPANFETGLSMDNDSVVRMILE